MRPLIPLLLAASLYACSPHKEYSFTHYYVAAGFDPGSGRLSSSVQMVFRAKRYYADSLGFLLDPGLEVNTLAAQDLDRYLYTHSDTGRLVLYLEDPLAPGDQLHISLHYSGTLNGGGLDSSLLWIPFNREAGPFTMDAKLVLPDSWRVFRPEARRGRRGEWMISPANPVNSIRIVLVQAKPAENP